MYCVMYTVRVVSAAKCSGGSGGGMALVPSSHPCHEFHKITNGRMSECIERQAAGQESIRTCQTCLLDGSPAVTMPNAKL